MKEREFTKAELKELERYEKYLNRLLAQQEKAEERRVKARLRKKIRMHIFTLQDLAVMLDLSIRTLRTYIKSGELRASLVGRHYLVTWQDLKKFLQARQHHDTLSKRSLP